MECCAGQKDRLTPEELKRRQDMPFFGVQVRDLTKDEGIEDQELQEVQVKSWMSGLDIKKAIRAAGVTSLPCLKITVGGSILKDDESLEEEGIEDDAVTVFELRQVKILNDKAAVFSNMNLCYRRCVRKEWDLKKRVNAVCDIAAGDFVAAACDDGKIYLIPTSPEKMHMRELTPPGGARGAITCLAAQNDILIAGTKAPPTVHIWDTSTESHVIALNGHEQAVLQVAALPDGKVVSCSKGEPNILQWTYGEEIKDGFNLTKLAGHSDGLTCLATLPDGGFVSGSDDTNAIVWKDGKEVHKLTAHDKAVRAVETCGSVIEQYIFTASEDATVRVWNETGECTFTLTSSSDNWFKCLSIFEHHDSTVSVGAGDMDGNLCVWKSDPGGKDFESQCKDPTVMGHEDVVRTVAWLPDGRAMCGSQDGSFRIWDVENTAQSVLGATPPMKMGKEVPLPDGVQRGHNDWIQGLILSSSGVVATCGWDNFVICWS